MISDLAERLREFGEREPYDRVADDDAMLIARDDRHHEHYLRVGREAIGLIAEARSP